MIAPHYPQRSGLDQNTIVTPMDHLPASCKLASVKAADDIDGADLSPEVLQTGIVDRQSVLIAHYVASPNYCRSTGTSCSGGECEAEPMPT